MRKATWEKEIFEKVFEECWHRCMITWRPIHKDRVTPHCFPHILAKKMYPKWRLCEQNIMFVDCSNKWWLIDTTLHSIVDDMSKWESYILEEILIQWWDPREYISNKCKVYLWLL